MPNHHVRIRSGPDSIGWAGLPSDPRYGCLDPPPFGKQCTLPRALALAACLSMPRCVAVVCPSQEPYRPGGGGKVPEPICQLRSHGDADERRHGMCRPSGCVTAVLEPIDEARAAAVAAAAAAASSSARSPRAHLVEVDDAGHTALTDELLPTGHTRSGASSAVYDRLPPEGMLKLYTAKLLREEGERKRARWRGGVLRRGRRRRLGGSNASGAM